MGCQPRVSDPPRTGQTSHCGSECYFDVTKLSRSISCDIYYNIHKQFNETDGGNESMIGMSRERSENGFLMLTLLLKSSSKTNMSGFN